MSKLFEMIEAQQKGHEKEPLFMIGEQLKDIARREPASAELLEQDLAVEGMGLEAMAAKLQEYADKHHGSARCFCITPAVAEDLIRNFYGLPAATAEASASSPSVVEDPFIDLASFL